MSSPKFASATGFLAAVVLGTCWLATSLAADAPPAGSAESVLNVVVMDPLAAPLSCPCVKGYAQRDYDQLGQYLLTSLGLSKVHVVYAESLTKALKKLDGGHIGLVIGKHSVVEHDLQTLKLTGTHVAALTGKDGSTTQSGLIVVPSGDPAKTAADLNGYRIIFGAADCDEKHKAAVALLKSAGVRLPQQIETCSSCSDGATIILELDKGAHGAAVISSYAKPLLEGCGTIQKGDLRVVAETEAVPFISAFVTSQISASLRENLTSALLEAGDDVTLCIALETRVGFISPKSDDTAASKSAAATPLTVKKKE